MNESDDTSEFGRGLCYCLGLFLAHAERLSYQIRQYEEMRSKSPDGLFREESAVEIWFNGAADHFYELQVDLGPEDLRDRLANLRDKSLQWRLSLHGNAATAKDAQWAIQEAKDLLRLIDESHGIPTFKGGWE